MTGTAGGPAHRPPMPVRGIIEGSPMSSYECSLLYCHCLLSMHTLTINDA